MKRHEFEHIIADIKKHAEDGDIEFVPAIEGAPAFPFTSWEWLKSGSDVLVLTAAEAPPFYVPVDRIVAITIVG